MLLWCTSTGEHQQVLESHNGYITEVIFSPNGKMFASHSLGEVRLWDPITVMHHSTLDSEDREYLVLFPSRPTEKCWRQPLIRRCHSETRRQAHVNRRSKISTIASMILLSRLIENCQQLRYMIVQCSSGTWRLGRAKEPLRATGPTQI